MTDHITPVESLTEDAIVAEVHFGHDTYHDTAYLFRRADGNLHARLDDSNGVPILAENVADLGAAKALFTTWADMIISDAIEAAGEALDAIDEARCPHCGNIDGECGAMPGPACGYNVYHYDDKLGPCPACTLDIGLFEQATAEQMSVLARA